MATVTPTCNYNVQGHRNGVLITWGPIAFGDTCAPVMGVDWADRTVQIKGTFGAGGSVTLEGSNDETSPTYAALTDPQGNAITKTVASLEVIEESPLQVRPNVTAGDGTTALTVTVLARRQR